MQAASCGCISSLVLSRYTMHLSVHIHNFHYVHILYLVYMSLCSFVCVFLTVYLYTNLFVNCVKQFTLTPLSVSFFFLLEQRFYFTCCLSLILRLVSYAVFSSYWDLFYMLSYLHIGFCFICRFSFIQGFVLYAVFPLLWIPLSNTLTPLSVSFFFLPEHKFWFFFPEHKFCFTSRLSFILGFNSYAICLILKLFSYAVLLSY